MGAGHDEQKGNDLSKQIQMQYGVTYITPPGAEVVHAPLKSGQTLIRPQEPKKPEAKEVANDSELGKNPR